VKGAQEDEQLVEQFRQMGVKVDHALPAWSGMRPFFGGYLNWNLLFTRWRVLAWRGETVELWTRWSGLPSRVLLTIPANEVVLLHLGRGYDRVGLGRKRVWVPSHYRDRLARPTS
jgi:hypothetical protein